VCITPGQSRTDLLMLNNTSPVVVVIVNYADGLVVVVIDQDDYFNNNDTDNNDYNNDYIFNSILIIYALSQQLLDQLQTLCTADISNCITEKYNIESKTNYRQTQEEIHINTDM
jgi:hypothetical protein